MLQLDHVKDTESSKESAKALWASPWTLSRSMTNMSAGYHISLYYPYFTSCDLLFATGVPARHARLALDEGNIYYLST